ncbi:hypothetical protein EYZ11_011993 [Aspergillus tanneri]|uniref:Uncharacterized protein n=1 Tax=Aspergillus tanneri TaxID=1220188 RepID=A0A4S3J1Y8_9EURO|nr:hypothetical protein EYZ11_011993 [Aspergillus tanneri]
MALIPVVPNIPFLYLVYRGWSHWREFLVEKDLLKPVSYPGLEQLYAKRVPRALEHSHVEKPISQMAEDVENSKDTLLLRMTDAKKLATILDAPELALEAERAIVQAEEQLQAQKKEEQEKNAPQKKHV